MRRGIYHYPGLTPIIFQCLAFSQLADIKIPSRDATQEEERKRGEKSSPQPIFFSVIDGLNFVIDEVDIRLSNGAGVVVVVSLQKLKAAR